MEQSKRQTEYTCNQCGERVETNVCHCGYTYSQHDAWCGCPGFAAYMSECPATGKEHKDHD